MSRYYRDLVDAHWDKLKVTLTAKVYESLRDAYQGVYQEIRNEVYAEVHSARIDARAQGIRIGRAEAAEEIGRRLLGELWPEDEG